MPTVTMMVGGIDKQIYLPYQLAQGLGYYKKYGVNMQLSTEQSGGVGAETAMASGQVDMAGAWYVHTIDFQLAHKNVIDVAQLSGAPGEREMCYKGSGITSPAQWRGKTVGVTDLGSGTDDLTLYLAARYHLTSKDFTRVAAGDGDTMVSALQHHRIVCGMTTQPTVTAIEKKGVGYSAIDLATTGGVQHWLGGFQPTAGVLARADWVNQNKPTVQKVVNALVATMHYIARHSAAQIADHLPGEPGHHLHERLRHQGQQARGLHQVTRTPAPNVPGGACLSWRHPAFHVPGRDRPLENAVSRLVPGAIAWGWLTSDALELAQSLRSAAARA